MKLPTTTYQKFNRDRVKWCILIYQGISTHDDCKLTLSFESYLSFSTLLSSSSFASYKKVTLHRESFTKQPIPKNALFIYMVCPCYTADFNDSR